MTPEGVPYYHNKMTNVTTWDKPDALKSDAERDKAGEWIWLPDPDLAFVPARKLQAFYDGRTEVEKEDGTRVTVAKNVVLEELSWSSLNRPVRDLVMLDVMNQPLILHNLKGRFEKNEIYTNVGTILISMNPYKLLPLYTPTIIDAYRNRGSKDMAPHIYTIADDSYNALIDFSQSQSIVISGESGAGKTECTKQCLQYLAEVAGSTSNVETRILQANPILESFGNAKTIRNNNSSRFGKYVEIFFDQRHSICGAQNTNYLLEKVRVVHQTGDERNYHVFYQLCAGASAEQKARYHLQDASTFNYLNQSGNLLIDGVDDGAEFREVESAMDGLHFEQGEKDDIFAIVAWILHLGNVNFESTGERKCKVTNPDVLKIAASLMQVDEAALLKAITNRVMVVRGQEPMDISLGVDEAKAARDALAKFVFAKLFDWLVLRINKSIGTGGGQKGRSIGILDIFGFEIFQLNSFEQLCINFANEKLQQYFNNYTFKLEESVYKAEQIAFDHVAYIDNQPVLDLIEQKPKGILPMIDEELRMPNGSDKSFVDKLHVANERVKPYGKVLSDPSNFLVRHYAGDVVYSVDAFLMKNKDRLSEDLYDLLQTSSNAFLRSLFPNEANESSRRQSLGAKFRTQLDELMSTLNATQPHYVRCIKPNPSKEALRFDGPMVLQQLRYSGVFEAITIRKQGFPFRLTHEQFMKRFRCLAPKTSWPNHKAACEDLIKRMGQDTKNVQIGISKVLYRAEEHKNMELKRNIAVEATVIFLQRHIRGWLARRLATSLRKQKPGLTAAIKSRNLATIEEALKKADGLKFPLYEWEQAKKLKALILEEMRVTALLEQLVTKDPEEEFENLSKAVASADDIKLNNAVAAKARELLTEVVERKRARAWLVEGVHEADIGKIEEALKLADKYQLANAAEDIRKAKEMKARIEKEQELMTKMTAALERGGYLNDNDAIDASELGKLVPETDSFVMKTKAGIRLARQATLFLKLRQCLSKALGTKDKALWKAVEEVVIALGGGNDSAEEGWSNHVEVVKAREEVAHQAAVEEVCEKMQVAVDNLDQDQLAYCLQQAHSLNVDVAKYPVVTVAQEYLDRIVEARRLIQEATTAVEQNALIYAVLYAESFGYDTAEVQAARSLRDQAMQLNVEAAHACVMLEEEPMKDILARADAIKLSTEDIEKIRTLLFNTPLEKLVQLQLKQAVALNDAARSIRVTIRLKDLFFKKCGAMFAFDNYSRLRSKEGWADMKLISFSRDELAAGMRRHTKDPIHDPLTEITDAKRTKAMKNMFKNILGFMGDKKYDGPLLLAQELCTFAINEPWCRDEIYCQLIKQLSQNPNRESERKGWWLMSICLESFPPPPEFENFLEIFLRDKAPADQRERLVKMLHATVYGGQRAQCPTESEMNQLLAGETLRARGFEKPTEYVVPQAQIPARPAVQPIMGVIPIVAGGSGFAAGYDANAPIPPPPSADSAASSSASSQPAAQSAIEAEPPARPQSPARPAVPGRPSVATSSSPSAAAVDASPAPAAAAFPPPPPPAAAPPPPPPPAPRPPCPWQTAQHPETGDVYYWHTETNQTVWDKPAECYC